MNLKGFLKSIAGALGIKDTVSSIHGKYLMKKQSENFNKGNEILLHKVDEMLTKNDLQYWLNYGTLLGAYRDHAFIKHDYDLDIGMWWKDQTGVKELFLDNGFKLVVEFHFGPWDNPEKTEFRFEYAGAYIDVDFYTIDENEMAYTYNPLFKDDWDYTKNVSLHPIICEKINNPIRGLSQIDFIGGKFWVPSNTEEYLVYNYGQNWKTPLSVAEGFDYHNVASNITRVDLEGWMQKY